ncbi:MAG: hypothetical protein ACPGLY_25015 [Rubripirellula sp.]|nr:hypothetical protein [Planctomycetaceae bacterium]
MKSVLALAVALVVAPGSCLAADLGKFGIGGVKKISQERAENVRGLGIFSRSTSAAGISMNIVDPNTGSQWNLFNTAFNTADDTKTTADVSSDPNSLGTGAETSGLAQISDMNVTVSNTIDGQTAAFTFSTQGIAGLTSGRGISGSSASFGFTPSFSVPATTATPLP